MYTPPTRHIKQAYVFDKVREAEALGVYNEDTAKDAEEQFDRAMKDLWDKAVTFGHNSLLTLPEKLDQNPFTTEEG